MTPSPFHPVTQFNSDPDTLVHPNLCDVNFSLHAHEVCGIVDPIGTDSVSASDNNRKKFLQSNQSNRLIESNPAASLAARNASADDPTVCELCGGPAAHYICDECQDRLR